MESLLVLSLYELPHFVFCLQVFFSHSVNGLWAVQFARYEQELVRATIIGFVCN
jgi:hypothetical protein